jgi:hydroxymethylpyrimidine pyrophosphatase-like HAD family hydrolase
MLKLCGKGVAMQNAIPQVKEITSFITATNDEDGVAKFLEENLL